MKKLLFLLLSFVIGASYSQIEDPVAWTFSVEKIDIETYNLVIEADIENGWNIYSQYVDPDGPVPTTFSFFKNDGYKLIDSVSESNAKTKFDPVFQMTLSSFQESAIFKQKVRIIDDTLSIIEGELEFMVCDATQCLPPDYVDMLFDLKKKDKSVSQSVGSNNSNLVNNKYIIPTIDLDNPIGNCGERKGEKSLWGIFFLGLIG